MKRMGLWRKMNLRMWWILRDFRSYLLWTFKPRYVLSQIKSRKGKCPPNCPVNCCIGCKYLTKNKRCGIYKKRFQGCRDGPMDRGDMWIFERLFGKGCSLYWD